MALLDRLDLERYINARDHIFLALFHDVQLGKESQRIGETFGCLSLADFLGEIGFVEPRFVGYQNIQNVESGLLQSELLQETVNTTCRFFVVCWPLRQLLANFEIGNATFSQIDVISLDDVKLFVLVVLERLRKGLGGRMAISAQFAELFLRKRDAERMGFAKADHDSMGQGSISLGRVHAVFCCQLQLLESGLGALGFYVQCEDRIEA